MSPALMLASTVSLGQSDASLARTIQEFRPRSANEAATLVDRAIRQGASIRERGANGSNLVGVAMYGENFAFMPRLLALGVPVEEPNDHGLTPWDLAVRRTGLMPPNSDWGRGQATLGLARALERQRRPSAIRGVPLFEARVIALPDPWDQMTIAACLGRLHVVGVPAGLVYEDRQAGGLMVGGLWLCVRADKEAKARRIVARIPRGTSRLRTWPPHPGEPPLPPLPFRELRPSNPEDRRMRREIERTLTDRLWSPGHGDIRGIQIAPRRYWDSTTSSLKDGHELRLVVRFHAKDSVYQAQRLADGTITQWFLASGPSPWSSPSISSTALHLTSRGTS